MPNPAPQRQRNITFPVPTVGDFIFYETVDSEQLAGSGTAVAAYGTSHPDNIKWPLHRLVHVAAADDQNLFYRYYYAADQLNQDDDNWNYAQADIGGTKFDSVSRNYITRRSEFVPDSVLMGALMADVPVGKFTNTPYVLAERQQRQTGDPIIDGLYILELRTYVKKTKSTSLSFDELSQRLLKEVTTLHYRGEEISAYTEKSGLTTLTAVELLFNDPANAHWQIAVLSSTGSPITTQTVGYAHVKEGTQLTSNWFAITTKQVVAGLYTAGIGSNFGSLSMPTYPTTINYSWPPVLLNFHLASWTKHNSQIFVAPSYEFKPEEYSGPTAATVSTSWSQSTFGNVIPFRLKATGISYSCPFFSLNIPACLHAEIKLTANVGTNDPTYQFATGSERTFAATAEQSWISHVAASEIRPARGGFILQTTTVSPPAI